MLQTLKKLVGIRAKEVPNLYNFKTIDLSELGQFPDGVRDMQEQKIDGFIIKNVLTREEVALLDKAIRALSADDPNFYKHSKGFAYPDPFSSLGAQVKDSKQFFGNLAHARDTFAEKFGVDVEARLFEIYGKMAGGRKVDAPTPKGDLGACMPFGVRFLSPESGVLEVHCGNLFHNAHSEFYDHIQNVDAYDQLSFFFMIQPSESSDLVLLDKRWAPGQHKPNFDQKYIFVDEKGKEVDCSINGIDRMTIRLEPGDFLTFTGGPIWHLVEEVRGEKGRITIGGFVGFSEDGKEILCWA